MLIQLGAHALCRDTYAPADGFLMYVSAPPSLLDTPNLSLPDEPSPSHPGEPRFEGLLLPQLGSFTEWPAPPVYLSDLRDASFVRCSCPWVDPCRLVSAREPDPLSIPPMRLRPSSLPPRFFASEHSPPFARFRFHFFAPCVFFRGQQPTRPVPQWSLLLYCRVQCSPV